MAAETPAEWPDLGLDLSTHIRAIVSGVGTSISQFEADACAYFDSHPSPDPFFNVLAGVSLSEAVRAFHNSRLLDLGLRFANTWEADHQGRRLHKGSGYYFAGMRDILIGDLERGFLFMHQALVEDQLSSGIQAPDTPALAFVTLDASKQDQAFRDQVGVYSRLVANRLSRYRASGRGALTLVDMRRRILAEPRLLEPFFQLVFTVARLRTLESQGVVPARENPFANGLFGRVASDLCLIIEDALGLSFPNERHFIDKAAAYAVGHMSLKRVDFDDANATFLLDFPGGLRTLLRGRYRTRSGSRLTLVEADLVAAYGVRNAMAHSVSDERFVQRNLEQIESRLFYVLFRLVEWLH